MKVLSLLTAAVSLILISAVSQAMENCPDVSKVEQPAPGVYRANGESGEWYGVLQSVVAKNASVVSFKMVLVIQEKESPSQQLQYCTYSVADQGKLDMRFIAKNEHNFSVKIEGGAWKKEVGPFGLIYNVCEKTAPENCKFTLIQ